MQHLHKKQNYHSFKINVKSNIGFLYLPFLQGRDKTATMIDSIMF